MSKIHNRDKRIASPGFFTLVNPVAFAVSLALLGCNLALAADEIQFNTDILDVKDRAKIDLNQFSRAGYIMPGMYRFTIRLNKSEIPEQDINFYAPDDDPRGSAACLTPDIIATFGLKSENIDKLTWWHNHQCLSIAPLKGSEIRPDLGSSALYISMPQAYLEYTADNWDPPSQWDNGIPGILFDYNVNAMNTQPQHGNDTLDVSGNGTTGMNMGPWRLRADWQARYSDTKGDSAAKMRQWDWSRYYAYRAISALRARLTVGEDFLASDLFDSFRYTGLSLNSDDKMLPPNLRGYAPEVTGVAKTNAKVTVSQQGRVISETQVAAGPFRIQDLNSAVNGKLDVKVQEQDGSVQTFQIDTANIPYLTRPGLVRFKVASGKPSDYRHHSEGPGFGVGEFSWGVNNGWSLYGGLLAAGDYNAYALGLGRDLLALGAISFDVTESQARLPHEGTKSGGSYRVSYSKRFDDYNSQVTFAGYRFSERNFMNMSQYLDARYHDSENPGSGKELYTITFNQQFPAINLSAYLNYSHQTYWNRPTNDTYNLSVSDYFDLGSLKNVSLSLTAYRTKYDGVNDDGGYVSVSLPFGNGGTISYDSRFGSGRPQQSVSLYDRIDDNNNYRISAGTTGSDFGNGSAYFTHEGDLAEVSLNAAVESKEYRAYGMTMQGGMTVTPYGAALHRSTSMGGTRMMVDTGGVSGVAISGSDGLTYSNSFGKAIITDMSSYYRSSVNVDMDALPDDVEATRSVVQGTLTEGAIGYRKFGIIAGRKGMATIKFADGSSPPFGATVMNNDKAQTGIVGEDGQTWLSGINPAETMIVRWGDEQECRIAFPKRLPENLMGNLLLPCRS